MILPITAGNQLRRISSGAGQDTCLGGRPLQEHEQVGHHLLKWTLSNDGNVNLASYLILDIQTLIIVFVMVGMSLPVQRSVS